VLELKKVLSLQQSANAFLPQICADER
jgi:hypothetical protein